MRPGRGARRLNSFKALWVRVILERLSQYAVVASATDLNGCWVFFEGGSGEGFLSVKRSLLVICRCLLAPGDGKR